MPTIRDVDKDTPPIPVFYHTNTKTLHGELPIVEGSLDSYTLVQLPEAVFNKWKESVKDVERARKDLNAKLNEARRSTEFLSEHYGLKLSHFYTEDDLE